jgi:cobalt/nickel transport system permease protein
MKTNTPVLSGKKADGFIERSVLDIVSFLKETVSDDTIASRRGFFQRVDPRLKCLSVILLLLSVLFSRSILEMVVLYVVCLVLAVFSSIGMGFFLKRTLFFIPLFSFFIVIPAVFNFVTPGEPMASWVLWGYTISITRQGFDSAVIFFMRVLVSVSLAVLLMLTTRHHVLLKVLRIFRIPQVYVMTMGMCYRYIYLFLDIIQSTYTAIKSRVGYVTSAKTGRRIVGANIASLWLRSYRLHTRIYDAMLSRGYTGEPRVLDEFRARTLDYCVVAISFLSFTGTLWLNHCIR